MRLKLYTQNHAQRVYREDEYSVSYLEDSAPGTFPEHTYFVARTENGERKTFEAGEVAEVHILEPPTTPDDWTIITKLRTGGAQVVEARTHDFPLRSLRSPFHQSA